MIKKQVFIILERTFLTIKCQTRVNENTFESTNFWYRVASDNNGFNQDWITAPKTDSVFANRIAIAPNVTQTYHISFTLHGTGEEQNYDQGKIFDGQVSIELNEE